jgi:hypothetical protein
MRSAIRQQFRAKATMPNKGNPVPPQLRLDYKKDGFKSSWLSDPSTYPIIAIISGAAFWLVGMGINALTTYKDVQISPNKRGSMMTTWGQEEHKGITRSIVEATGGVKPEGLGIDHEKWAKEKEAALNKE